MIGFAALLLAACTSDSKPARDSAEPMSCAVGEILDGEVCVPEACGVGTWGNVAEASVYIDVDAAEGGDGSEAAPMRSIQAGLDLAADRDGGIVAVAAGTYLETIAMRDKHHGVTLAGRCRELVTLDGSGGEEVPTIEVVGERLRRPEVGIEGVTVMGGRWTGMWLQEAVVSVRASDLRENTLAGLLATDAGVTLDAVGVYDSQATRQGDLGHGIGVQDGAVLTATGCTVQGNTRTGVYADGEGTTVALVDTVVLDTSPSQNRAGGYGVNAVSGAALSATRCTVQGNTDIGVFAAGALTTVDLVDTQVLDTSPTPNGTHGRGIDAQNGAVLTATGCTIQGNTDLGVNATGAGTTVELVGTRVLDTAPGLDSTFGRGIEVQDGATLTATDCSVQGSTEAGVVSSGTGATIDLVNTEILDTSPGADDEGGVGVMAQGGGVLTATGCTIQGSTEVGVVATGAGTSIALTDTRVLDTFPSPDGTGGQGIQGNDGAALTAIGCIIQGNAELGVSAGNAGTTVDLEDTDVLDTSTRAVGSYGRGIQAEDGATLTATDCRIQGNTEAGVVATDAGTTIDLVGTVVLDTGRGRSTGFARGVHAQRDALIRASDCEISGTEGPGLYVAEGQAVFERVLLTGNTFAGAAVAGGSAAMTDTTITDTLPDAEWGGGFGAYTNDAFGPSTLTLTDSTIGPHDYAAIWLDGQGTYDIQGSTLSGSDGVLFGSWPAHGNAVFAENGVTAWDGATGLRLTGNTLIGASQVAVLLHGASALLDGNTWSDNTLDVLQQHCTESAVPLADGDLEGIPNWGRCPSEGDILTDQSMRFTSLYLPEIEAQE